MNPDFCPVWHWVWSVVLSPGDDAWTARAAPAGGGFTLGRNGIVGELRQNNEPNSLDAEYRWVFLRCERFVVFVHEECISQRFLCIL